MNFFEAQDNARKATRRLVAVYVLATLCIVAGVTAIVAGVFYSNNRAPDPSVLAMTAACAALLIVGATLYKTARLAGGGSQVARELGGTEVSPDTTDPLRRRLRNVVEEMAIASGVPVPDIYVLERETGINAFAAGFTPGDAAVAVTRGTLELLSRDELQGVIAHEFSHVLNGDMRLSMRMMGVLFGIMVLGLVGRMIVRGSYYGSFMSSRRGRNSGAVVMIGLGLLIVGWIGVFFARMIKAGVSRQREYLADASAVQFTRHTDGIAGALKKIAGYTPESFLQQSDPEEVSHMLFARGSKLSSLFATHPPLVDRIRALDPSFRPEQVTAVELDAGHSGVADDDARQSGFAASTEQRWTPAMADAVGNPTPEHVAHATLLRGALPATLYDAAHATGEAWLVCVAVFVPREPSAASRGYELLEQRLGSARTASVRRHAESLANGSAEWRLALLEIAFPALKRTPVPQLEFLLDLCRRLIDVDGRTDLHEFCLYRVLEQGFEQSLAPTGRARGRRPSRAATRQAALDLLALVAHRGNSSAAAREAAFAAAMVAFGDWARDTPLPAAPANDVAALAASLDILERMTPAEARTLVSALGAGISADGRLTVEEAELLRAVCGSLKCPLPPLAVDPAREAAHGGP